MTTPTVRLSQILDGFGSGGANIPPSGAGGTPSMRDTFRALLSTVAMPFANSAAMQAGVAADRFEGQFAIKTDDHTLWVWSATDSTAADTWHIVPTDSASAGRWIRSDFISEASGSVEGSVQRVSTTFNLAAIQGLTSGVAFNIGSALPANARFIGVEAVVTAITGGSISQVHLTVQGGTDAAGTLMASTDVFTASGTFATPGSNPYQGRGGQQLKGTLTTVGDTLAHATAGAITFNVLYAIVP